MTVNALGRITRRSAKPSISPFHESLREHRLKVDHRIEISDRKNARALTDAFPETLTIEEQATESGSAADGRAVPRSFDRAFRLHPPSPARR
jgi:hypothetical protein